MSNTIREWIAQVNEWKRRYNVNDALVNIELTNTRTYCFRCGKVKRHMHRHHTGNDMIFARMLPDHFAKNYVLFRREDWEKLCSDCHRAAHRASKSTLKKMWAELNQHGTKIITPEWCEKYQQQFRKEFYDWCKRYKPRKRRKHR